MLIRYHQIFIIITLTLFQLSLNSQTALKELNPKWSQSFNWGIEYKVNDFITDKYDQIVSVGQANLGIRGLDIIIRVNKDEQTVSINNVGGKGDDVALSILEMQDGYLIVGYTTTIWSESIGKKDAFIVKIDNDYRPVWTKVLGTQHDDTFYKIIKKSNNYTIVGSYAGYLTLVDINALGEILKIERTRERGIYRDACFMRNGSTKILLSKDEDYRSRTSLITLNENYEEIERQQFQRQIISLGRKIKVSEDQKIVYIGGEIWEKSSRRNIQIISIDENSKIVRPIFKVAYEWDEFISDFEIKDDYLIMVGHTYSHKRNAKRSNILLSIQDIKKNEISNYQFGTAQNEIINKLCITYDSEVIIGGAINLSGKPEGWISKLYQLPQTKYKQASLFDLSISNNNEINQIFKKEYHPNDQIEIPINASLNGYLPQEIRVFLKSDSNCIKKEIVQSISNTEIEEFSIPITIDKDCPKGEYQVEVTYNSNGVVKQLLNQIIRVADKPYYDAELITTTVEYNVFLELYEISIDLKNNGNTNAEIDYFLNVPDYIEIKSDTDQSIRHNSNERIKINFDLSIKKEYIGDKISFGLVLDEKALGANQIIPIDINTIEALDKINEIKLEKFLITLKEQSPPALAILDKVNEDIEIVQDIIWQHPIIDRSGQGIDHNKSNIPLRLRITSNIEISKDQITLTINDNAPIEGIQYYRHNEQFLFVDEVNDRKYYSYKNIINLIRGENKITIAVNNQQGESIESTFYAFYDPPKNDLHVFSIGIDYRNTAYPLNYTTKDANDIASSFRSQEGILFNNVHEHVLNTPESTTAQNLVRYILKNINDAYSRAEIQNEDMIVLYISGHGYIDPTDQVYRIAGSDFDDRTRIYSSIDYGRDILSNIQKIPCKKLILFDACNSGAIASYNNNSGAKNIGIISGINLGKALEDLSKGGDDLFIISSSSANQKSYEDDKWQNGAFTEAFLEALTLHDKFAHADQNKDDVIYIKELYNYVRNRVPELVRKTKAKEDIQVPYMDINKKNDLPIFYMGGQ